MHLLIKNSYCMKQIKKALKPLCTLFFFLLCSPLFAVETGVAQEPSSSPTLNEMKSLLDKQIAEWNEMKPALKRLIKAEQDIALIVATLDKISPLSAKPNEQQLLESKPLTLPNKKLPPKRVQKHKKDSTITPTLEVVEALSPSERKQATNLNQKQSIRLGIHLASYKNPSSVMQGWKIIKTKFRTTLGHATPFYYQVEVNSTTYTRLVIGPFSSKKETLQICKALKAKSQYCQTINYIAKEKQ